MRFIRPLFTFVALLSLLLCIATVALWVRSYRELEGFGWERRDIAAYYDDGTGPGLVFAEMRGVVSWRGGVWVGHAREMTFGEPGRGLQRYTTQDPAPLDAFPYERLRGGWDFAVLSHPYDWRNGDRGDYRGILFPHWALTLLTAILPVFWLKRRFVSPPPPGHCQACGYDLRASRGRCPECGCLIDEARAARL